MGIRVTRSNVRGAALGVAGSLLAACASQGGPAASIEDAPDVGALLRGRPELFGDLLERADEHRIKVEVALVVDAPGGRTLARGGFERGPEYFYPASSVKTCAVIAASQLLAEIDAAGLTKHERVITSPQGASIRAAPGGEVLNFCANNYLGQIGRAHV